MVGWDIGIRKLKITYYWVSVRMRSMLRARVIKKVKKNCLIASPKQVWTRFEFIDNDFIVLVERYGYPHECFLDNSSFL